MKRPRGIPRSDLKTQSHIPAERGLEDKLASPTRWQPRYRLASADVLALTVCPDLAPYLQRWCHPNIDNREHESTTAPARDSTWVMPSGHQHGPTGILDLFAYQPRLAHPCKHQSNGHERKHNRRHPRDVDLLAESQRQQHNPAAYCRDDLNEPRLPGGYPSSHIASGGPGWVLHPV